MAGEKKECMQKIFGRWLIGTNYWPRDCGTNMWQEWSGHIIRDELAQARLLGCRVIRIFLIWPRFQPKTYKIDNEMIHRLDELVEIAREVKIQLIPTIFVGYAAGTVWDVPWRSGCDPYSDAVMVKAQEYLVRFLAERYHNEPHILFWDIANKPSRLYRPEPESKFDDWAKRMRQALKEIDVIHPVTIGLDFESATCESGFSLKEVSKALDFVSIHAFPEQSDLCPEGLLSLRSTLFAPFAIQLTRTLCDKPVLLEEFGSSSLISSMETGSQYYQVTMASALANGAIGALSSSFGDISCSRDEPYDSHPYELGFGMTTTEGEVKECGLRFKQFADIASRFDLKKLVAVPCEAAILIPQDLCTGTQANHAQQIKALFNAFVLAKQASMEVAFVSAQCDLSTYKLLIIPSVPAEESVKWSTWQRVIDFVADGGTVLASYNGVAFNGMDELFGFKRNVCAKHSSGPISVLPTSSLPNMDDFNINNQGLPRLYVSQEFAALARSEDGHPLVTYSPYGEGNAIFITIPLELALAQEPEVLERVEAYKLYHHAGSLADLSSPFITEYPGIEHARFIYDDRKMLIVINHTRQARTLSLRPNMFKSSAILGQSTQGKRNEISLDGFDYQIIIEDS